MSSRLSTSRVSLTSDSSAVASSSATSSGENSTSGLRSEPTEASAAASGVRRSWLTAASSAVRILSAALIGSTSAATAASRSRSRAAATWAAKAVSIRCWSAGSLRPVRISSSSVPTGTSVVSVPWVSRGPEASLRASTSPVSRESSATESRPKVLREWSSRFGMAEASVSRLRSTVPASVDRLSASAVALAARWVCRAARSTTVETVSATAAKTIRAITLLVSPMVKVCTGGMK